MAMLIFSQYKNEQLINWIYAYLLLVFCNYIACFLNIKQNLSFLILWDFKLPAHKDSIWIFDQAAVGRHDISHGAAMLFRNH